MSEGKGVATACTCSTRLPLQAVYKREDLYRTEPAYRISGKEEDIQWEILTNGPVQGKAAGVGRLDERLADWLNGWMNV